MSLDTTSSYNHRMYRRVSFLTNYGEEHWQNSDVQDQLNELFNNYPPFPKSASLMSLLAGIIGNLKINLLPSSINWNPTNEKYSWK